MDKAKKMFVPPGEEEVEINWRDSFDSKSDSVILRSIDRDEYLKNKLIHRFKNEILSLLNEGTTLQLRYQIEGLNFNHVEKLETTTRILKMYKEILNLTSDGVLNCRLYPLDDIFLDIQFSWNMPVNKLQSRSQFIKTFQKLQKAHQHKKLEIDLQFNKSKFEFSNLIGFSFSYKILDEQIVNGFKKEMDQGE